MPGFRRLHVPLLALALSIAAVPARAAPGVPLTLTTNGYLLDGADVPVTQLGVPLGFSVWSDPDSRLATSRIWPASVDSICVVDFAKGYYAAVLDGSLESGCGAGLTSEHVSGVPPRYLQVSVDGTALLPRMRLGTVPNAVIAIRAGDSDTVGGEAPAALHDAAKLTGVAPASVHAGDSDTVGGEAPAALHDAAKLTGVAPASVLGLGSTGLTTLGTLTTGTWNATPVADEWIASASAWNTKIAGVGHDGTLVGDGTALAVLGVNVGTAAGSVAAGDDARFGRWTGVATGLDAATARTSLGLGTAATTDAAAYATAAQGTKADGALQASGGTVTGSVTFPGTGVWSSNGRVGIGTTSPAFTLDVVGDVHASRFLMGDSAPISANLNERTGTSEYPYVYSFTVPGDAYTFYPVAFLSAGNGIPPGKIVIARNYSEAGPVAPAPDASHLGGLQAVFTTSSTAWADYNYLTLQSYRWTYVRTIGDCGNLPAAASGRTLWCRLRGGGFVYHVWSNYPLDPGQPAPGSVAYDSAPYLFSYPGTLAAASLPANSFAPGSSIVPVAAY